MDIPIKGHFRFQSDVSTTKGYINITFNNELTAIECDGYIISISSMHHQYYVVIILNILERGMVPCVFVPVI